MFVLETTDGEYRTPNLVLAVGVARAVEPVAAGHRARRATTPTPATRRPTPASGSSSSASRTPASSSRPGSPPGRRRITVCSPSPAKTSIEKKSLVGVRARYVQPFEDNFLGLGVKILDASIDRDRPRRRRAAGRSQAHRHRRVDQRDADEVIAATGFTCPLLDLPELGVTTFGQAKLPAVTPLWESADVPGIFFAGTISQAPPGLKKHGIPAYSGAVQGHRYNALILARHIAESRFGVDHRPARARAARRRGLPAARGHLRPGAVAPEGVPGSRHLASSTRVIRDEGILPVVHALDGMTEDVIVMTVEADGTGALYPVVYCRRDGRLEEHPLPGHPLLDFATREHADALQAAVGGLIGATGRCRLIDNVACSLDPANRE